MILFDIFSFKKEALKVFSKENIKETLTAIRGNILEQAKKELTGEEKKRAVDVRVIYFIREKLVNISCTNKLVLWVTERLIDVIPTITQLIYNFLKEKVEEL